MNETTNFLLVGDLNARKTCIGCKAASASGKILSDYLMKSDSVLINDSSNTYFRFESDYEEKLDLFKNILSQKAYSYSDSYITSLSVNTLNQLLTDDILSSANTAIPKFKLQHKKSFPKHIIDLIQLKRQARKNVKSNSFKLEFKTEYNRLTSVLRSEIKKYTEVKWKCFLCKLGPYPVSSRSFWAITYKARDNKKTNTIPVIKASGKIFKTDLEKANLFSSILGDVFQDGSEAGQFDIKHRVYVEKYIEGINWCGEDSESFSLSETLSVLGKLRVSTSPGDDCIHNILLKKITASYVTKTLLRLVNL